MVLDMSKVRMINLTCPIIPMKDPVSPDDIADAVLEENLIWPLDEYKNYIDDSIAQIIKMKSHLKTHTESPYHLNHAGRSIDQYPPQTFIARCVNMVFDEPIGAVIDLEKFKQVDNGRLKKGDFLVAHSTVEKQLQQTGLLVKNQMPAFTVECAHYMIEKGITVFGSDMSVDFCHHVDENNNRVHDLLLKNDIPLLEMLTNLDQLTQDVSFIVAVPGLWAVQGIDSCTTPVVVLEGFDVL